MNVMTGKEAVSMTHDTAAYDAAARLALGSQTYESDFCAIAQMLGQESSVDTGLCCLECRDGSYIVTGSEGTKHSHLLREYAIHHLLYCCYAKSA